MSGDHERWEAAGQRRSPLQLVVLGALAVVALGLLARAGLWSAEESTLPVTTDPVPGDPVPTAEEPTPSRPDSVLTTHAGVWDRLAAAPLPVEGFEVPGHHAVWTGSALVVADGDGFTASFTDGAWTRLDDLPLRPQALVAAGPDVVAVGHRQGRSVVARATDRGWEASSRSPLPELSALVAVWTGEQLLIWGVTGSGERAQATYDPGADRWGSLPPAPVQGPPVAVSGRWVDGLLVVWGSLPEADPTSETNRRLVPFAAAFDPIPGTWRKLPPPPLDRPEEAAAVWTGQELLLWGRPASGGPDWPPAGAAIDPWAGNADWGMLPAVPGQDGLDRSSQLGTPASVWTGDRMVIASGLGDTPWLAYQPTTASWTALGHPGRGPRTAAALTWTGHEILVWGGARAGHRTSDLASWRPDPPPRRVACADGAESTLDLADTPDLGTLPGPFVPTPAAVLASAAMNDHLVVVYAAHSSHTAPLVAATHHPAEGWRCLPAPPLKAFADPVLVWTGTELVVWGGLPPADAAAYDAATRTWRRLPASPLFARVPFAAVWTGTEVLVWGSRGVHGRAGDADGAAYDPQTNRWRSIAGAPHGLSQGNGVWSGTELVILGSVLSPRNEGDEILVTSYDPTTDRWKDLAPPTLVPQATNLAATHPGLLAWDYAGHAATSAGDGWSEAPQPPFAFAECRPKSTTLDDGRVFAWYCGQAAVFDPSARDWSAVPVPDGIFDGVPVAVGEHLYVVRDDGTLLLLEP